MYLCCVYERGVGKFLVVKSPYGTVYMHLFTSYEVQKYYFICVYIKHVGLRDGDCGYDHFWLRHRLLATISFSLGSFHSQKSLAENLWCSLVVSYIWGNSPDKLHTPDMLLIQ